MAYLGPKRSFAMKDFKAEVPNQNLDTTLNTLQKILCIIVAET